MIISLREDLGNLPGSQKSKSCRVDLNPDFGFIETTSLGDSQMNKPLVDESLLAGFVDVPDSWVASFFNLP